MQGRLATVENCHAGAEIGDLVIHVLDGMFELETIGPGLGHLAADLRFGGRQIRFRHRHGSFLDGNLNLVWLRIELDQPSPFFTR